MQLQRKHDDLIVVSTRACCAIAMGYGLTFGQGKLTWGIGLMSALPPFAVAWCAAKQKSIVAPFVLFSGAYGAYNGILLMRLAFLDRSDYPYPIELTNEAIVKSGVLSALGAVAIVLVWLFRSDRGPLARISLTPEKSRRVFRVGIVFLCAASGFYWLELQQLGGYVAVMGTDRVERLQLMKNTISLPYISFLCVSIALIFLGSEGKRKLRRVAWFAFATWIALLGLQGDRGVILQLTMVVAAILGTLRPRLFRVRIATFAAASTLIFLSLLYEQVRPVISIFVGGTGDSSFVAQYAGRIDPYSSIQPEKTELGGPYLSLIEAASVPRALLLGKSYLEALPTFLPRFLYPGLKPIDLSDELAESVSTGDMFAMGWGYSPVSESYRNFGVIGVPIIMAGWASAFLWLGRVQSRSLFGLLLSSILFLESVFVNRIDFRSVYIGIVFNVVVLLIAIGMIKLYPCGDSELTV